jgi:hypothetical protein
MGGLAYLRQATPMQTPLSNASTTSLAPTENFWDSLHVHILPLFNGELLRIPVRVCRVPKAVSFLTNVTGKALTHA